MTPATENFGRGRQSRPGIVAGAVLRAARLSANVSKKTLAAAAGVTRNTIRCWESGSFPLASAPALDVHRLEAALDAYGASQRLVTDLDAAVWCDLIVCAIADDEDVSCLLADPITGERAFRELLSWSLTGKIPARYRRYFAPSPLIANPILVDRTFHSVAAIHPALAADCVPAPAAYAPGLREAPHAHGLGRDPRASSPRTACDRADRRSRPRPRACRRSRR